MMLTVLPIQPATVPYPYALPKGIPHRWEHWTAFGLAEPAAEPEEMQELSRRVCLRLTRRSLTVQTASVTSWPVINGQHTVAALKNLSREIRAAKAAEARARELFHASQRVVVHMRDTAQPSRVRTFRLCMPLNYAQLAAHALALAKNHLLFLLALRRAVRALRVRLAFPPPLQVPVAPCAIARLQGTRVPRAPQP
jgi:hypothetical protein